MRHTHRQQQRHSQCDVPVAVVRNSPTTACMMQMSVDTVLLSEVRQLVMHICGDALQFMRIEACQHGTRMHIWLCVSRQLASAVMAAVLDAIPDAEFGRLAPLQRSASAHAAPRVLS